MPCQRFLSYYLRLEYLLWYVILNGLAQHLLREGSHDGFNKSILVDNDQQGYPKLIQAGLGSAFGYNINL